MINYIAQFIGILGILAFLISYQQRTRRGIIVANIIARVLILTQYVLLGAYAGAAQNAVAIVFAILAEHKDKKIFKENLLFWMGLMYVCIIGAGALSWTGMESLLPIFGMLLQTSALWMTKPRTIRILSLVGTPFWSVYNVLNGAYSALVCDILGAVSIGVAFVRYDILKNKE